MLYNTFWIFLKLSAAQKRVAQIRVAQGLTVLAIYEYVGKGPDQSG